MSVSEERDNRKDRVNIAFDLMNKGYSKVQIAKELSLSENTVRALLAAPDRFRGNDDIEMTLFDQYFSDDEKLAIAKEFVGNMTDANFERYKVLPIKRKAYLLSLYAEKNHNVSLGIEQL